LANRKYHFDESYFSDLDTEDKQYIYGFILADGTISKPDQQPRLKIALAAKDTEHLNVISNKLGTQIRSETAKDQFKKEHPSCVMTMYSKQIWLDLYYKFNCQNKTLHLSPECIENHIPDYAKHHCIRGLFDGDGGARATKAGKPFAEIYFCGTESMMTYIRDLLHRSTGCSKVKVRKIKKANCYVVSWAGAINVCSIRDWMYRDAKIYLQRKKDIIDLIQVAYPQKSHRR